MFDSLKSKATELLAKGGDIADELAEKAGGVVDKAIELKDNFARTVTIKEEENFVRILAIATPFPTGFCFDGGKPVDTQLIDWFNPLDQITNKFPLEMKETALLDKHRDLASFVQRKDYYQKYKEKGFIILCLPDYGYPFLI